MKGIDDAIGLLSKQPNLRWLLTGVAGFIGSNILQVLLEHDQTVVGVDNLSTGRLENLRDVESCVGGLKFANFTFIQGDLCNHSFCEKVVADADIILHQAALGSVPRSIKDPVASHHANVSAFVNLLDVVRQCRVERFVYASSSSVYGDSTILPKQEGELGKLLSPYAATKRMDEMYAGVFADLYKVPIIGLRYFNVFGPRQDPNGAYAAVIPRWINHIIKNESCIINGDGLSSRDFCFVKNVVQANLRAALTDNQDAFGEVMNIAVGNQCSLTELYSNIVAQLKEQFGISLVKDPIFAPFRDGDVRHSLADITKAKKLIGYHPDWNVETGLKETVSWFFRGSKEG